MSTANRDDRASLSDPPQQGALIVDDLAVARGGVLLLSGLSFRLDPGRALVLRGPNGLGKTSLLRCLAGLQLPVAGRMSLPAESVAYAGHADGLKSALTVTENLAFWAAVHGRAPGAGPKGLVGGALAAMNLESLGHRPAGSLSAGQKRRLGLARLLVAGRAIWMLDEPTVSLDQDSVALFAAAVRGHLATGGAALIATHIDLGIPEAAILDLAPYRAQKNARGPAGAPGGDGFDADDAAGAFA